MNKIEEAITEHWGERCADSQQGCPCCDAWAEYDALAAERDKLRNEALDWRGQVGTLSDEVKALRAERDKLAGQLADAVEALQVYAGECTQPGECHCGYTGNQCCMTAHRTLSRITGETA